MDPELRDRLRSYWAYAAPRERDAARLREGLELTPGPAARCAACGSASVHIDAVGDRVCRSCSSRLRGPSSPDGTTCPSCGSGAVHTNAYGDHVCRGCGEQWRSSSGTPGRG